MNQTLTVNIGGLVFHIEVDAYETLKNYLNKIKGYFSNSVERDEIMLDIESRIAELFSGMKNEKNQVVTSADVDSVIEIMGKPEQYINEETEQQNKKDDNKETSFQKSERKLFRDPDEKIIGGVCSGFGAYIGVDTVWIRLFFVIALLIGFGLITYVIMWIVMPEAKNASDKLKMRGEPINVQNIGKKIEEEANNLNDKLKNMKTDGFSKKAGGVAENFFNALATIITSIFNILGKVIGIAFLIIGVFLFVILLGMLFGSKTILSITREGIFSIESHEFFNLIFVSQDQYYLAIFGALLVLGIPIISIIYLSVRLLFKFKVHNSVSVATSILFIIGVAVCTLVGINMGSEISSDDEIVKFQQITPKNSTFVIQSPNKSLPGEAILNENFSTISVDGDKLYMSDVELAIEPSKTDSIMLEVSYTSNGGNSKEAAKNAKMIDYQYELTDSSLNFDNYFSTHKDNKIRGQEVQLTLYIPRNHVIYLDESVRDIIYDVDNVTNTYDKKMVRNKWVMLESGLTCLDCYEIKGITSTQLDSLKAYIPIH